VGQKGRKSVVPKRKVKSPEPRKKRNYKREYALFHGKPEQIKKRSNRNKARRKKKLKVGDGKEVHHRKPLSKGGTNSSKNIVVVKNKKKQRVEGGKIGKRGKNAKTEKKTS
jgi:hypothetical protein